MVQRSILIVGAGVGGLSAGCYGRMNGYAVTILEKHSRPGGVCTGWTREGYVFDGCLHNLAGTAADSRLQTLWRELGVIPRLPVRTYDELVAIERPDGEPLVVHTDLSRLQAHLKALSPADGPLIDELIAAARAFARFDLLGLAMASPVERMQALAQGAPLLARWGGVTLAGFARRFKDPFLRQAFPSLIYDWPGQSMLMALYFLGRASVGDLGWVEGGAQALSGAIADRFTGLGGEIRYGAAVRSILVEDGRAVGVRLEDGTEERADIVISNANGDTTIHDMLGGRWQRGRIRRYYRHPEDRIEMGLHVSLGLARDLSAEPHALVLPLPQATLIDGDMRRRLYVEPFGFDPTLAVPGHGVLKVVLATSWRRWRGLARDPAAYRAAKARAAETVIGLLEPRFPGLRGQIEVVDVATPVTTWRITGNGQGFRSPISRMILGLFAGARLSQTLPRLKDFYMVGQWAGLPGVPLVAAQGRDVIRDICPREGRAFRADDRVPAEPDAELAA